MRTMTIGHRPLSAGARSSATRNTEMKTPAAIDSSSNLHRDRVRGVLVHLAHHENRDDPHCDPEPAHERQPLPEQTRQREPEGRRR